MSYVIDTLTAIGAGAVCGALVLLVLHLLLRGREPAGGGDEAWRDLKTFLPDCASDFDPDPVAHLDPDRASDEKRQGMSDASDA